MFNVSKELNFIEIHFGIIDLYRSVGWTNYLERVDTLRQAYTDSLCVLGVYDAEQLVGIIRAVGDGLTIVFIQDYKMNNYIKLNEDRWNNVKK